MSTLKQLVDETTNIKNELVDCHSNLKNNLIEKGVECSDTDKMSSLIDKVKDINLGKKWASGEVNVSNDPIYIKYLSGNNVYALFAEVNSLEFIPSLVYVYSIRTNGHDSNRGAYTIWYSNLGYFHCSQLTSLKDISSTSDCAPYMFLEPLYINETGFKIPIRPYSNQYNLYSGLYGWVAFE